MPVVASEGLSSGLHLSIYTYQSTGAHFLIIKLLRQYPKNKGIQKQCMSTIHTLTANHACNQGAFHRVGGSKALLISLSTTCLMDDKTLAVQGLRTLINLMAENVHTTLEL